MNYTVYMHTAPNGKVYIGITGTAPKKRWDSGRGYSKHAYFSKAINKYGWDNIEHTIIAENLTQEQAEQMEIKLIEEYDAMNRDKGYNRLPGGGVNRPVKKVILLNTGVIFESLTEAGKQYGVDTGSISRVCSGKCNYVMSKDGSNEKLVWRHLDENNQPIKPPQKAPHKNSMRVAQIDLLTGEIIKIWNSMSEAGRELNIPQPSISAVCRGKRNKTHGYVWKYAEEVE